MALDGLGLRCVVAAVALSMACGTEDGNDEGALDGATDPSTEDSGATESGGPAPTDTGTDDSGSDSGSSDTGEPLPECPEPDPAVMAAFSVTVDGVPVVADYAEYFGGVYGVPRDWQRSDTEPEIDGECEVVEQVPGSLTLTCTDTLGVERTFAIALAASEALSTDVGEGPVHLWYLVNEAHDILEHVSDTAAHAFVVSNDTGIVLAGIDGRYSIDASLSLAWPQWPTASIGHAECSGPYEASFGLEDGTMATLPHGSAGDLGPYRVLVETADVDLEFDGEFDQTTEIARWLLGLPASA